MADKRLQEIRTSDDADSAVNVELIEWLKTSGVNYLLFILVMVILFRGYLWWGEHKQRVRDEAWADLAGTDAPASLEALAERAKSVDSVAQVALLKAADIYQMDILRDQTLEVVSEAPAIGDPNAPATTDDKNKPVPRMTEAERSQTLDRMEANYRKVYESTMPPEDGINWKELLHLKSMFGLAAVAEMRGDFEAANDWYARIESDAPPRYSSLADIAVAWKNDTSAQHRLEFLEASVIDANLRELPGSQPPGQPPNGDAGKPGDDQGAAETQPQDQSAPAESAPDGGADEPSDGQPAPAAPAEPTEDPPAPGDGG